MLSDCPSTQKDGRKYFFSGISAISALIVRLCQLYRGDTINVESDCGQGAADDDHGVAAAPELVYGESGDQVVSGRDGDQPVPRAVCGRAVVLSAGAGSGGAGHRDGRRLPVRPGRGRAELDELSAAPHGGVRDAASEAGDGG